MIIEKKDDIYKLIDKFEKSGLAELELELGSEFKIRLSRMRGEAQPPAGHPQHLQYPQYPHPPEQPQTEPQQSAKSAVDSAPETAEYIKSPLLGTFYSSPSPESEPFVPAAGKVKKGMTLCIIEAMKVMNEVECEFDCEIIERLAENGQIVEYGQPLFRIKRK